MWRVQGGCVADDFLTARRLLQQNRQKMLYNGEVEEKKYRPP